MKITRIAGANKYEVVDNKFNKANYPDMIGKVFEDPPGYANVKLVKDTLDKPSIEDVFKFQTRDVMWSSASNFAEDFVMKSLKVGHSKDDIIDGLGKFYRQAPDAANSIFTKAVIKIKGFDKNIDKTAGWDLEAQKEDMLLEEAGVLYSPEQINSGQQSFEYTLEHLKSGKKYPRVVWSYNESDFLKLLSHWNRDSRWKVYNK